MKVSVLATAVLASTASAIRIIELTSTPIDNLHAFDALPPNRAEVAQSTPAHPHGRPCGKSVNSKLVATGRGQGSSSFFPGPIGALLSRLGINRGSHEEHHHGWHHSAASTSGDLTTGRHKFYDALKEHMEEIQGEIVPILEGGIVKILPVMNENGDELAAPHYVEGEQGRHRHGHHEHIGQMGHGRHGHHGHHRGSFSTRFHRAVSNLTPTETLIISFVFGAGLGSILHFFFMIFLLTFRVIRGRRSGMTCRQRREARREARRARKAAKAEGGIKLVDEVEEKYGEVLPSYEEGEGERLVVEARA